MYSNQVNNSTKKTSSGIPFLITGIIFLLATIGFTYLSIKVEENVPDDAEWYKATITEIISEEEDYKTKTKNDKKVEVKEYDYEYVLEYKVNGTTYETIEKENDRSSRIHEGDTRYVRITADNPENIYMISTSADSNTFIIFVVLYVISGALIVFGIITSIKARKKRQATNDMFYPS